MVESGNYPGMAAAPPDFSAFLADDESVVVDGIRGTLVDGTRRSTGVIGLTDRRLVFRSDRGRFVEVAHDAVSSIQSQPTAPLTRRGVAYRGLIVLGACLAMAALLSITVIDRSGFGLVLLLVAVGGATGSELARRHRIEWSVADAIPERLQQSLGGSSAPSIDPWLTRVDERDAVVVGLWVVALVAVIGLIGLTRSLVVLVPAIGALGGLAVVDYADRQRRLLDALGRSRHRLQELTIHLASGRSLHFQIDEADRIDHDLSGILRSNRPHGRSKLVGP